MKRESWAWWTTEPWLGRLQWLLAAFGMALLAKLAWVLGAAGDGAGPPVVRATQAMHCVQAPVMASYRRDGIARVLSLPQDMPAGCWRPVALPHYEAAQVLQFQAHDQPLGRAWFRLDYVVPPDWPASESLLIYSPRVMGAAWQVRVDGEALADNLDDWRMTWNRPVAVRLPSARFHPGQALRIDLALAYVPKAGHSSARISVGPASKLGRSAALREYFQLTMPQACSVVLLLLGAFFFAFWWVRREEKSHLLLACASVAWSVCNLQYALPRQDDPLLEAWYAGTVHMSVTWFMWLVYLFTVRFDNRRMRWVEWALPLYVLAMSLLAVPVWGTVVDAGPLFQAINTGVALGVTVLIGVRAVRSGSVELRVITATLVIALLAGVHDLALLTQAVHPESLYTLPYGGLLVFASFLFAVQRRYVNAINDHESLSASLAQRLAQREAELNENHQRLRELEREHTLAGERQRLMRDMHDGLGSALTSSLAAVERGQAGTGELAAMLRECVDDLRVVIDSLDPIDNDLVALLATLRFRVGRRLEAAGVRLEWEMQDLPALTWMRPPEALQVMRIVQELLSNIVKHAQASRVRVSARRLEPDSIEVRVADDGCGFDPSAAHAGRGLRFLKQRSAQLGGTLAIDSSPGAGAGTCAQLVLPVNQSLPHPQP